MEGRGGQKATGVGALSKRSRGAGARRSAGAEERRSKGALWGFLAVIVVCALLLVLMVARRPGAGRPKNVLLISIDTLRSDHLGCYGYSMATPAIDSLAERSVVFETVIAQVPLTLPSHCSILTGLYPNQHGVRNNENFILPDRVVTVAELFRLNGYATGAVVGSFSLDSTFGLKQGFDYYDDKIAPEKDPSVRRDAERKAESVWKLGRAWLEKQKGLWFCFLHFFDPHTAYNPPQPYPQSYDGEIAYVDRIMDQVLKFLEAKGLINTTIVVLLSDHGESLWEHGEATHGFFLYDVTLKVPLMIAAPGLKEHRIGRQVRLVDVAPTLSALAGLEGAPTFPGINLLAAGDEGVDLPAYSESYYTNLLMGWARLHSIRWKNRKWINAPRPELYDLALDPGELHNLYAKTALPSEFRNELQKHLGSESASAVQGETEREVREKLASLGYITGGSGKSVGSAFDPKDGITLWIQIEAAVTEAQLGNLSSARIRLLQVLQQQPDNVIAHKLLAHVYRKQGNHAQAIVHLKKASEFPLHQRESRFHLAETYYESGRYTEAMDEVRKALELEPQNAMTLRLAAFTAVRLQKYTEADALFEKLRTIRPNDAESIARHARVLSLLQKDDAALQAYEQLARIRPLKQEDCTEARKIIRRLESVSPEQEAAFVKRCS